MPYVKSLSSRQKIAWSITLLLCVILVMAGMVTEKKSGGHETAPHFTVENTIKEIAHPLNITGKALCKELGLPPDTPKMKPLKALEVTPAQLEKVLHHLEGHKASKLKYFLYAALVLFGWMFMTVLGRPSKAGVKERKAWYPRWPYVMALILSVVFCGFMLGKSPNPMEGAVKVFKTMAGLYPEMGPKLLALIFFLALGLVGNKLICGWACPFGALQELVYSLPGLKILKQKKVPFWFSNGIRTALFILMLLMLFGIVGGKKGFVVYHFMNPFNLFNLSFEAWTIAAVVILSLVLGLFLYRPFCHFICPFGLLSWIAEKLSIVKVRVDQDACTQCGACAKACPSTAAQGYVDGKFMPPDCFSCARCLNVCMTDAIAYRGWGKKKGTEEA